MPAAAMDTQAAPVQKIPRPDLPKAGRPSAPRYFVRHARTTGTKAFLRRLRDMGANDLTLHVARTEFRREANLRSRQGVQLDSDAEAEAEADAAWEANLPFHVFHCNQLQYAVPAFFQNPPDPTAPWYPHLHPMHRDRCLLRLAQRWHKAHPPRTTTAINWLRPGLPLLPCKNNLEKAAVT